MRTVLTTSSLSRVSNIPVSCLSARPILLADNWPPTFLLLFATQICRTRIDRHRMP